MFSCNQNISKYSEVKIRLCGFYFKIINRFYDKLLLALQLLDFAGCIDKASMYMLVVQLLSFCVLKTGSEFMLSASLCLFPMQADDLIIEDEQFQSKQTLWSASQRASGDLCSMFSFPTFSKVSSKVFVFTTRFRSTSHAFTAVWVMLVSFRMCLSATRLLIHSSLRTLDAHALYTCMFGIGVEKGGRLKFKLISALTDYGCMRMCLRVCVCVCVCVAMKKSARRMTSTTSDTGDTSSK